MKNRIDCNGNAKARLLKGATALLLLAGYIFSSSDILSGRPRKEDTVIKSGLGIGSLTLGMSEESVLSRFPFDSAQDQEWNDACGDGFNWVGPNRSNILFRFREGKLIQLEARNGPFHTAEPIRLDSPLSFVAKMHPGMRAYRLSEPIDLAQGDKPLVFWVDSGGGIAFALAYDPEKKQRYLYYVVVFAAGKAFCPEGEEIDIAKWQEIPFDSSLRP